MVEKPAGWGYAKDSAIMPSLTVQIPPMPPGAATPAQPSTPAQAAPASAQTALPSNAEQR